MPTAVKTKNGHWKCRAYNTFLKKQKQFTADSKREAERLALLYLMQTEEIIRNAVRFEDAADEYLNRRSKVLSPNTYREYIREIRYDLAEFGRERCCDITSERMQSFVNARASICSAKTVRNNYNLAVSIIKSVLPDAKFAVNLPKASRRTFKVPSEKEIRALLDEVRDTEMEVPILLALFGPMRRGEVCALDMDHVEGDIVHVQYSMAKDECGRWVKKSPKTYAGDRFIPYPEFVIERLPSEGPVTNLTPDSITHRMPHIMRHIGLDYTFHQLRHWSVSYLHRMGLSDQEILDRAGWESTEIFKEVYRHSLRGDEDRAVKIFRKFT